MMKLKSKLAIINEVVTETEKKTVNDIKSDMHASQLWMTDTNNNYINNYLH